MSTAKRGRASKARKGRKRLSASKITRAEDYWECVVCGKMCGGGLPQGRTIDWQGSRAHACNACGISWRDLERKKRVVDKRAPTDIEWATWKATRPNFRLPMSDEDAAWALVKLSRSGTSATSSSSSSSSSSTASSSASASIVPSASPSYPDWSYSPFTSAPAYPEPEYEAATMRVEDSVPLKVNRPASLYVNVGFTDEDEEAWPEPEFSESSDHSPTSTMFELSTPTSFSFAPGNEVLFAAPPKNLIEGHSAYQKW